MDKYTLLEDCSFTLSVGISSTKLPVIPTLLAEYDEDHFFCWSKYDLQRHHLMVTNVTSEGKEDILLELEVARPGKAFILKAAKGSPLIPARRASRDVLRVGELWVNGAPWTAAPLGASLQKDVEMSATQGVKVAGLFTRFHEGRALLTVERDSQLNWISFLGIVSSEGSPVVVRWDSHMGSYFTRHNNEDWEIVPPSRYTPEQTYLLDHGVPHLLLKKEVDGNDKVIVVFPGVDTFALEDAPHCGSMDMHVSKGCWWGLPTRRLIEAEFSLDARGGAFTPLVVRTREQRIQMALIMLQAYHFDFAFAYLESIDHLAPWTDGEIVLLRTIMALPSSRRDAESSYARLYAAKLLRDECMRFAAPGCDRKLISKAYRKSAQEAMDLVLQTKHLMPVHRVVDMRNQKLTKFFAEADFEADRKGFRGWLNGGMDPAIDLTPTRQSFPSTKTHNDLEKILSNKQEPFQFSFEKSWSNSFPSEHGVFFNGRIKQLMSGSGHHSSLDKTEFRRRWRYDPENMVASFLWNQPVLPVATSSEDESYQMALLVCMYELKVPSAHLRLLEPLVKAWLFYDSGLRRESKFMLTMMQLLYFRSTHEAHGASIELFETILRNDYFAKTQSQPPAACCDLSNNRVWIQRAQTFASQRGLRGSRFRTARRYDWNAPASDSLFESDEGIAAAGSCNSYQGSAESLRILLLEAARAGMLKRADAYVLFPAGDDSLVDILVRLFAEGGSYGVAFPNSDKQKLDCLTMNFMLKTNEELRRASNRNQTLFLHEWSRDVARTLLVFEYQTRFTVRTEQLQQLRSLLVQTDQPLIQQIIMGGGKTSVLSPVLLKSFRSGMFMSPQAVFSQNAKDLVATSRKAFGQRGFTLACYRSDLQQRHETLAWTLESLKQATLDHDYILMMPKTLQCFQNLLMMSLSDSVGYQLIINILTHLKGSMTAVIDEVDTVFDPNLEVNFPLRKMDVSDDLPAMVFLTAVFSLPSYPGENSELTPAAYNVLREKLAKELVTLASAESLPFSLLVSSGNHIKKIALDLVQCSADFLTNKLDDVTGMYSDSEKEDCSVNRDMQIIRFLLKDTLYQIIKMRRNVHYGLSFSRPGQTFVIPYASANKPVEGSKFSNYMLAVGLTCQYYFLAGLSDMTFVSLIREIRKTKITTSTGKSVIEKVYELASEDFPQLKDVASESIPSHGEVSAKLLRNQALVMCALNIIILPSITVSGAQITNYALNMDNVLNRFIGFSGTMSSKSIFPKRATLIPDAEVEASLRKRTVEQEKAPKGSHIHKVDDSQELVKQLVTGKFSHTNALLDCGAFLRHETNRGVARRVLELRSDLEAVFFYHDVKNEIVVMLRDGTVAQVDSTQKLFALFPDFGYDKVFLYCDQQHTVGTDIRLGPGAAASLTVNSETNLEELMQAIMRMRNYQGQQSKSDVQDVLFAFASKAPESLQQLWSAATKNTLIRSAAAKRSVGQREANLLFRNMFFKHRPAPEKSSDYSRVVFQREQDFLVTAVWKQTKDAYDKLASDLPFKISDNEEQDIQLALAETAKAYEGYGDLDVATELELEVEQEIEAEIQRLNTHDHLDQTTFTNNPAQLPHLYAFCDEVAAEELGFPVPAYRKSGSASRIFPCVPLTSWLDGDKYPHPSPVLASLGFAVLRPSDRYDNPDGEQVFFSQPSTQYYQVGTRSDASLLVDDTRKNVHNVFFMMSKRNVSKFNFVLVSSDEAQELKEFCSARVHDIPDNAMAWFSREGDRLSEINRCEDEQRNHKSFHSLRLDAKQQWSVYGEAYGSEKQLKTFLANFWKDRVCAVFDPLSLPNDFLAALIADDSLQKEIEEEPNTFDQITKALVDVLALSGSEQVISGETFAKAFQNRMSQDKFSSVYKKIRDFIDEPIDPQVFSELSAKGQACKRQCAPLGYEVIEVLEHGRTKYACSCKEKKVERPEGESSTRSRARYYVSGVVFCCCVFLFTFFVLRNARRTDEDR
eukprot:TRINITY_DN53958_c0_g1_i1.p1 TRINITY_DN53958_c0_g1~~TRINITY_DN53958_c0_g1_i1.p1  ORF type:complete len:2226 (+),score=270.71 TRINITY_DN53958_c0_g1_i1:760-6678(+)